jgi:inositol transporter-like SP family MFS transporter
MATSEEDVNRQHDDDSHVTGQQWKWTVLAGMASYLDAGSIVALAAGLALWQEYLGMSSTTVGLLAALGPNAFGAAIGALIGGVSATCSAASASTSTICSSMVWARC